MNWDESLHPREPAGHAGGGQFTSGSGSSWARKTLDAATFLAKTIGRVLSPEENEAIGDYSGLSSKAINALLRHGKERFFKDEPYDSDNEGPPEYIYKLVTESIKLMDKAFDHASVPQNMLVYRAIRPGIANRIKNSKGGVFVDKGFVSTSLDKEYIKSHWPKWHMFPIVIRKGAKALPVQHISEVPVEREVIINRGTQFKVHKTPRGRTYLEVK